MNVTTEDDRKFVPVTVSVNDPPPAPMVVGEIEAIDGTGLFTVNVCAFELPPPGAELATVMKNDPADVRKAVGIVANSCVALTYMVDNGVPFHWTVEVPTKLEPLIVSVVVPEPI